MPANETRRAFVARLDLSESGYIVKKRKKSKTSPDKLKTLVRAYESRLGCAMAFVARLGLSESACSVRKRKNK